MFAEFQPALGHLPTADPDLWHNLRVGLMRINDENSTVAKFLDSSKWRVSALFAMLFCSTIALAADPATVTFSLDFPNSTPEHYLISVESDGRAHYESAGKFTPDSDLRDQYQNDFTVSDVTRARIFELAAQAHYFSGKIDASKKKIAFTGTKKLAYKDGQRNSSAEYNFSSLAPVEQLTGLFQSMGATLEFGHRLEYDHRYQKLALDDELKRMEDQARHGELSELQALRPLLQEIYDDTSVMNVVRARAHRIMELEPTQAAGH